MVIGEVIGQGECHWSLVNGHWGSHWSMVIGEVIGQWSLGKSLVNGHWGSHWSMVIGEVIGLLRKMSRGNSIPLVKI